MADDVQNKKPKPIGTPAPNVSKPKQEPVSAPKQQLAPKQNAKPLSGAKIQPGSPFKSESTPVGVQQKKFESPKHANKRVNKMFGETNQPTLGIWNKDNTHPMAKPDQVKMNPKLNYKPTEEQLQAANRKKIMQAGFAPKNWDGKSDIQEPVSSPAPAKNPTPNPFKGNSMPGFEGMGDLWDNMMGSAQKVIDNGNNPKTPAPEAKKKFNVTLDGDHLGEIEAADEYEAERLAQQKYPGHPDDDLLSVEEQQPVWDKNNEPGSGVTTQELENWTRDYLKKDGDLSDEFIEKTVSGLHTNSKQADFYKSKMKEEYERNKASELFGTDLNKNNNKIDGNTSLESLGASKDIVDLVTKNGGPATADGLLELLEEIDRTAGVLSYDDDFNTKVRNFADFIKNNKR